MEKKESSKSETKPKASKKSSPNKKDFLVVGLGASAGGIKALQEFFSTMPPNSQMAFVVILHLSPDYDSNLAEIIQSQTAMSVAVVNETLKVEPNRVYVIPPNRHLEMVDGVIRSMEPVGDRGARVAIDVFFRTLADEYTNNAVSIILSGTGTDGTLGMKAIKEANGFAIVQDPYDAEHDSMPRSAISTHLVDWVLPVSEMPERLIKFRDSSERLHLTKDGGEGKIAKEIQADKSLREVLTVLRVRTGHDFSNYKTPTLIRRIARHLQIHDLEDIPSYLAFLRNKPDEIHSLLKNLLINVTNFFRDKEAWKKLESEVVPHLFANKHDGDTVRVWSCGCASGEEAYSLAIILSEYASGLLDPPKIKVFATDVDEDAIAEGREHFYPHSIEADVSTERLKKFFVKETKHYRLKKELREKVLFAPHNVLRDPPFSRLDLIACRNLLIYLNRETQERVMEIFHFALVPRGYLFLGNSETAETTPQFFQPIDKRQRIYQRRPSTMTIYPSPQMLVAGRWQARMPEFKRRGKKDLSPFSFSEVHYRMLEKFAPPSVMVSEDFEIQYMSDSAGRYLRFKGGEPSKNLLKLIHPDLLPDLRAALFTAQREKKNTEFEKVSIFLDGEETSVKVIVGIVEIEEEASGYLLIIFDEDRKIVLSKDEDKERAVARLQEKDDATEAVISRLEAELKQTKENLRATIEHHEIALEEHKASNEELQAINEELRSTTEELETSKEELQSVNEELTTVNHELKEKMAETSRANTDLQNLMASTDIATIFLDRSFRIKRFTTSVEHLFNITAFDVGRPLEHFTHRLDYKNLADDAAEVLRTLKMVEREVRDYENRTYLTRFSPYRTADDRIEGVVLNFIDITKTKHVEQAAAADLRDTQFLRELATQTASEGGIQELYDKILDAAIRLTNSDAGTVQIFDDRSEELVLLAAKGFSKEMTEHFTRVKADSNTSRGIAFLRGEREFHDFDKKGKDKDGSNKMHIEAGILSSQSTPLISRSGNPIGMFTTHWRERQRRLTERELRFLDLLARQAADLIEQCQAEEKLRKSEELFRAFVTASSNAVFVMNPDWSEMRILDGKNFITDSENPNGGWLEKYIPEEDKAEVLDTINEAVSKKEMFDLEHCVIRVGGSIGWAHSRAIPLLGEDGEIVGWFGTARDITQRKIFEDALRKSQEELNLILESTKDYAIITFDLEGRITRWNTGAEKIFGWTEEEALGQTTHLIFTQEDRAAHVPEKEIIKTIESGRAEDDRWHLRKDGSGFFATGVMQLLRDGKIEGFVKICRDQTEQIKTETALKDKQMLTQLVNTQEDERRRIARDIHDHLGQQLTVLRLKLEHIKKQCEGEKICEEVEEAQKITEKLDRDTDFLAWELRPAALDDLGLRATLGNFVQEWSRYTGIGAGFHASGLTRSRIDFENEINLYRIAQEALNNVHKHAKAKNVSVLLEKRGDTVALIIEDDGVGFNPADKKNRAKGIGLTGMSERAKISGGKLEIESQKGKGTTVFVRVPAKVKNR